MIDPKVYRIYARISGVVFTKMLLIVAAYFIGEKLDRMWGTYPLFIIALIIVAASLGIWWLMRVAEKG